MTVRPTRPDDVPALQKVLDDTGLFPGEMLPGMVQAALSDPAHPDIWLTCDEKGTPVGFCYAAAEDMAVGVWNMRAIAVSPTEQGHGYGSAIVAALETMLKVRGQRLLIAETSGLDAFAPTRAFYAGKGYVEEARIRDFWAAGDDKVVFSKSLA